MTTDIEIVARPNFRIGPNGVYDSGDRWDRSKHEEHMQPLMMDALYEQGYFLKLTKENYARMMARHQPGHIGKGFTEAELIELGILDKKGTQAPAPDPKQSAKAKAAKIKADVPDEVGSPIDYRGYVIIPIKQGNFTRFEVMTEDRRLLREKRCATLEKAHQFLDTLADARDSDKPPPESKPEGPSDGVQLQYEPI